ncbi:MAG: lipid-A-disaccharide synthase [Gammaproteobacteria bacterium]|nr:lipid-A-disaccharide synthase [Gammaproteobacteria bacterium]
MYVGVVAGETSGDQLGAGLIRALQKRVPEARFVGICGPNMQAVGATSLYPMDSISIMGVDGLLRNLIRIIRIRRRLLRYFLSDPPDIFIGIDVPDFNLGLERRLKRASIKTVHYVSPTVWAWRSYRIRKIRRSVSHMLTLFPFEEEFYKRHNVPVTFVGHPIADEIDNMDESNDCRSALGLPPDGSVVALLPGSRLSELHRHTELFANTAAWILERNPNVRFVAALVDQPMQSYFRSFLQAQGMELPIYLVVGRAREAMAASDTVLLASGTAALEAALLNKPMVVTYKVSKITYLLVRLFAHVKHFSMPNNLLENPIVPEFIQDSANPESLGKAVEEYLLDKTKVNQLQQQFAQIRSLLQRNANERAAGAVMSLMR